jgi:hypothetical protein
VSCLNVALASAGREPPSCLAALASGTAAGLSISEATRGDLADGWEEEAEAEAEAEDMG